MPNRSKNINMFLMDGEVTGIINVPCQIGQE